MLFEKVWDEVNVMCNNINNQTLYSESDRHWKIVYGLIIDL